jgi:hypothetical protein
MAQVRSCCLVNASSEFNLQYCQKQQQKPNHMVTFLVEKAFHLEVYLPLRSYQVNTFSLSFFLIKTQLQARFGSCIFHSLQKEGVE